LHSPEILTLKKAHELKERGVEVLRADLQDPDSLTSSLAGAYGVFGVTTPLSPKGKIDTHMEWEQGRNIADACLKNGVINGQAEDDAKVPYIACRDIGEFARLAFEDPATFIGQKLNLVGDFISGNGLPYFGGWRSIREIRLTIAHTNRRHAPYQMNSPHSRPHSHSKQRQ
jgi:hypothetical protein